MQAPPPRRQSQDPLQDPMQYYHESLTVDTEDGSRFRVYRGGRSEGGTVLFLLHGAGHCAMSWAFFTKEMRDAAKIVAMDLRGHGATQTSTESDMSLSRLAQDVIEVIQKLCPSDPLVLFGHSMGGAVAVQCAALGTLPQLKGLFVLDVVEGTALESLALLPAFLKDRPTWFPTLEAAVEWVAANEIHNRASAEASTPCRFVRRGTGWTWRTDLGASSPFWNGWFEGMDARFLSLRIPKVLVLAGSDRLDTPLTIAHMQGRFQLSMVAHAGHCIQEDNPRGLSHIVIDFLRRYGLFPPGYTPPAIGGICVAP